MTGIDTSKLRGRIAEKGYTISSLANEIGISRVTLGAKLHGKSDLTLSEVLKIASILDVPQSMYYDYFFAPSVPCEGTQQ